MTELLELGKDEKILEIGTGSGFQAAILAQFSRRVYTIERHRALGDAARKKLRELGHENVVCKIGDGTLGWPQYAPYDKIIVTAGAPAAPHTLTAQLAVGGRMIIPAGDRSTQQLEMYDRTADGITKRVMGGVVFVPLIGKQGWEH
jgi:protein-L-isoaspartate(D-aspartate) O-methyltransferase